MAVARPPDPAALLALREAPVPVTVLTGFLGSGKTTLLRHLLARPRAERTAVIVNEFGEVGLDHALIESATEETVVLSGGCLCCRLSGDLEATLRRLLARAYRREVPPFERVVVETSGLSDPAPILQTLMSDPLRLTRYRLGAVVATVDGVLGAATLARHRESVRQAAVADRLLVTKVDMAAADAIDELEARLATLNPTAPVTRVAHGRVDPAALFAPLVRDRAPAAPKSEGAARHEASIQSFCLTYDRPLDWTPLAAALERIASTLGEDVLRFKGLVNVADEPGPVAVHGVQHVFHRPEPLAAWPDEDRRSRLVFVTRGLSREVVEGYLARLAMEPAR